MTTPPLPEPREPHGRGRYDAFLLAGGAKFALAVAGAGLGISASSASAVCSVFDEKPCTPYFCGVYDGPDCIPDIFYPLGQDLRLTIDSRGRDQDHAVSPEGTLNTLRDVFAALRACWGPPPLDRAGAGMEISVRLSFKRDGNMIGAPFITYQTRTASAQERRAYRDAMTAALQRCTPLPLSQGLGNAMAGRIFNIRFVDDRT